jgi:hypothetical protein
VTSIAAIEQTQGGLPNVTRPTRAVRAVYGPIRDRATTRTLPKPRAPAAVACVTTVTAPRIRRPPGGRRSRDQVDPQARAGIYFQR